MATASIDSGLGWASLTNPLGQAYQNVTLVAGSKVFADASYTAGASTYLILPSTLRVDPATVSYAVTAAAAGNVTVSALKGDGTVNVNELGQVLVWKISA